jgi:phytoene dehydrogenase-like protein
MIDFSIVGGGIGGVSMASLLDKEYETHLFEKEKYLGGSSGTFFRGDIGYNIGATTFALYGEKSPVGEFFKQVDVKPDVQKLHSSITIIVNEKRVERFQNFENSLNEIEREFPHRNNRAFWNLVKEISDIFFDNLDSVYYDRSSIFKTLKSGFSFSQLLLKMPKNILRNGRDVILDFYPDIDRGYYQLIENQARIVAQTTVDQVPFLVVALSLSYTLYDNYYAVGGMSRILDMLSDRITHLHRREKIVNIEKIGSKWLLESTKMSYQSRNIILNSSLLESSHLFINRDIRKRLNKFEKLDNGQSAFVLYLKIKSDRVFNHHYQIIEEKNFPYTISNSIFVSFSDQSDIGIAPEGYYSVTVSTHTMNSFWVVEQKKYSQQKKSLEETIIRLMQEKLDISSDEIVDSFSASPLTFKRYIGRTSLGGSPMTIKNILKTPPPEIGVNGLFVIGDNSFMGQGWPGVLKGSLNLKRVIDDRAKNN